MRKTLLPPVIKYSAENKLSSLPLLLLFLVIKSGIQTQSKIQTQTIYFINLLL